MSRKFMDFAAEATRREKKRGFEPKPYVIDMGEDEKPITVEYPDAQTTLAMASAEGNSVAELKALFRKNPIGFNRLIDALDGQPAGVISVLIEDMMGFWGNDVDRVPGK